MTQRSIQLKDGKLLWMGHHAAWLKEFKDGLYIIELRKEKSKASHPMMKYLWGYVYQEIVRAAGGSANKLEIDYIHAQLKKRFGIEEIVEVPRFKGKQIVYIDQRQPKSLSKYTVEEMQDYWIELQKVGAEVWGIVIHDPDPEWRTKWIEWQNKQS